MPPDIARGPRLLPLSPACSRLLPASCSDVDTAGGAGAVCAWGPLWGKPGLLGGRGGAGSCAPTASSPDPVVSHRMLPPNMLLPVFGACCSRGVWLLCWWRGTGRRSVGHGVQRFRCWGGGPWHCSVAAGALFCGAAAGGHERLARCPPGPCTSSSPSSTFCYGGRSTETCGSTSVQPHRECHAFASRHL